MKPLIFLSNDDGYQAKGFNFLIDLLRPFARIVAVAPEGSRSGMACACTFDSPIRVRNIRHDEDLEIWSCSGTPVDCVKWAFHCLLTETPAMVIGGINHGDNSAINAHYSGTIGVVLEGCMKRIPSVAFSLDDHDANADFSPFADTIREVVQYTLAQGLPVHSCLNVNFPKVDVLKGVRVCRMAYGQWKNEFACRDHPRGGNYYWLTGYFDLEEQPDSQADRAMLQQGYATITPLTLDLTDYVLKAALEKEFHAPRS